MRRFSFCVGTFLFLCALTLSTAAGQMAGSRLGAEDGGQPIRNVPSLPTLDHHAVERYIAIDGRAEVRVRPTEIRIVLAITSERPSAPECRAEIEEQIRKLKADWLALGITAENIVEDFISVLPMYEWAIEERGGRDVGVEKKNGFRMQTNIHLAVPNDETAPQAFTVAFQHGVADIIGFDYWSRELDGVKIEARNQAVQSARGKADALFSDLLGGSPPIINLQEQTTIFYPESLYHSFVNTYQEGLNYTWRQDIPFLRAHRPRNTYYRGLFSDGDIQPRELPMNPEISVISTVRLYYESPAAKNAGPQDDENDD